MSGKTKAKVSNLSSNKSLDKSNKKYISDVPESMTQKNLSEWQTIRQKVKEYPKKISNKIFKIGLDKLFKKLSPIIMKKITYQVEHFSPHFDKGTDSFIKSTVVYMYNSNDVLEFKHDGEEYKLKIFSDLIFKCNRKNKDGKWINNSFMDRLIEWAKPSDLDIIFKSRRRINWKTKKPISGEYVITAQWTYHRSKEDCTSNEEESDSNEEDDSSE